MGTSTVGRFFGEFGLNVDPFLDGVRTIERETKTIANTIKPLKNLVDDLAKSFLVMGGSITGSLGLMVKQSADYGEQLNKVAVQTGITTEQLSGLKHAADQNETSFEALTVGLKKMSSEANTNAATFKEIGVRVADAGGHLRPMNDILLDVSDRFSKMADGTRKSALAMEIFGRSGTELIPTLNLGREGLADMRVEADKLGLTMGGDAARAADDFNDSMSRVKDATLGLSNAVAAALIPALTDIADVATDTIIGIKELAKEHEGLTRAIGLSGAALTGAGGFLAGLALLGTAWPKIQVGLELLDKGFKAIGVSSMAATAGLAAVAYWAAYLIETEADLAKTRSYTAETTKHANDLIMQQWEQLERVGVVVNKGKQSWEEFGLAVGKAYRSMIDAGIVFGKAAGPQPMSKEAMAAMEAAAKKKADFLIAMDKKVHDFRSSLLQVEDGLFKASLDEQKDKQKAQADFFIAMDKKVADYKTSVLKVEDGLFKLLTEEEKAKKKEQADFLIDMNKKIHDFQIATWGVETSQMAAAAKAQKDKAAEMAANAERVKNAWANAMASLTTRVAESISAMVVNFKFSFESLVGIAKQTAQGMLSAFLSGLMNPLTGALGKLGQSLSGSIMGAIGIGGAAGPAAAGTAATGAGGALGGMGLFGLSGAATLGIGAAVAGAALIANHFIGQGRNAANAFTSGSQDQFGIDLGRTFGDFQKSRDSGTLTLDQAQRFQSQLSDLITGITDDANAFKAKGKNEKKVIDQFFAAQESWFGPGWSKLTTSIDTSIEQLKASAAKSVAATATAVTGPTAGLPETGRAISASTIFASAVDVFKDAVNRVGSAVGGVPTQITIEVTSAPEIHIDGAGSSNYDFVKDGIPEFKRALSLNNQALAETIARTVKAYLPGVVTTGGATA